MIKKNSIFIKVLIPVVIVMLLQTLLISFVLTINGTIKSLEDSAVDNLNQNADNRSITLENMMIHNWSNLDKLEGDIYAFIDDYLAENDISLDKALSVSEYETNMLFMISNALLNTLRANLATGVFMYFVEDAVYIDAERTFRGLYYRDLDPFSTPADYSDIQFLKGYVDIARKDKIPLDYLWNESFVFSPQNTGLWNGFSEPLKAALEYPELATADVSYWSEPYYFNINLSSDSNECITYTRPLVYDGRVIGMIGTEMQVEQMKKYFPANDFDSDGKSGYMIVKYNATDSDADELVCELYAIAGGYIKRQLGTADHLILTRGKRDNVSTFVSNDSESFQAAVKTLRLYNVNAPFSGEQWALVAIGADSELFGPARNVNQGIFISTSFALIFGIGLLAFLVRLTTKPLISIANQISASEHEDPVIITNTNTYEIALLCSTLNTLRDKRRKAESELREERERYLFALESATDTFLEYDLAADSFMLYYFSADSEDERPTLHSAITHSFLEKIHSSEICHEDEIQNMLLFFSARISEPIEIRFKSSFVSYLTDGETDGGYYWFLFKASHILGDDGSVAKVIGIAREITHEKLDESARIEATRRDITTGLYKSEYGDIIIKKNIYASAAAARPFALMIIRAVDFELFEAYYGKVFSAVIFMKLSRELTFIMDEHDTAVRIDNDGILVFIDNAVRKDAEKFIESLRSSLEQVYAGENPDLRLKISAGIVLGSDKTDYFVLREQVHIASWQALKHGKVTMVFYNELSQDEREETPAFTENPTYFALDISKKGMVAFAFDLFEQTTDIQSAVNILMDVLGNTYELSQILVCLYEADFDANQVGYQWNSPNSEPYNSGIEKVRHDDFISLEKMLDENGTIHYTGEDAAAYNVGVRRLLCVSDSENVSVFGCAMFENGVQIGRMLFKSADMNKEWNKTDTHCLYEITKIISANVCIYKSNSASRAKSEFLSRMSHEIRTPMNAIIGMTSIAKESLGNTVRLEDCLTKIDFSAKHLLSLINDVLEMSRIESGKLSIGSAPFSMDVFADSIDTLMRPQADNKRVSLVIDRLYSHKNVIGDEYRLRQVLVNIIGNACKFTEAGGVITFSIEEKEQREEGYAVFRMSVRDTGVGISREDQPNIFKAFEQAKEGGSAKKNKEGTGLGLAISSNIISAMNSRIELISEQGEGSEFFFTLRMALGDEQLVNHTSEAAAEEYAGVFNGKKILLVEDNDINIEIATFVVEEIGITVEVAKNGQEAVDKFQSSDIGYYDAILMDIQMPVMDGLTATRHIRKNTERSDARSVPIIAMTANAFDEDMKKSIESGMNGHIPKPIDTSELYSLLRRLLKDKE